MEKKLNDHLTTEELEKCCKRQWSKLKASAKRRQIGFTLDFEETCDLILSPCAYCGSDGSNELSYNGMQMRYNGIDRIDSAKPYEAGNVVSCCSFCNALKGSMPISDWLGFLKAVKLSGVYSVYKKSNRDLWQLTPNPDFYTKTYKSRF